MNGLKILNEYFDKIFVITLHRSKDRHEKINKHLASVDFEYFYGVDKLDLTMEELISSKVYDPVKSKKMQRNSKAMYLGQVACSLSHRELYSHILEKGYEKVLIMEDDFVPVAYGDDVFLNIIKELPKNWELVYWGYYLNESVTGKMKLTRFYYAMLAALRIIKWTPKQVANLYPKAYSPHLRRAGFHNTTHAYAVSKPVLQKLIDEQTPVAYPADSLLTQLILSDKINAFITMPKIFEQEIFMEGGSKVSSNCTTGAGLPTCSCKLLNPPFYFFECIDL